MLYNDQPIGQDEEDKLNRTPFVDEIVELIDRYTEVDEVKDVHNGLVIGLEGEWGSGKTSVLNLLENRFQDKNGRYVVQRLDSWLALDCVTLTVEFFKTLGAAALDTGSFLDGADYVKENAKKIPKGLMNLAKATGLSISTPFVSFKPNWEDLLKEKSLRIQKEELKKTLSKSKKYIIYMIDDIDRLNSKEIAFVMQLVKNIADFPKVIYILSYDREIVTEALQRIDGKNGRDFMEKIIQVPIQMPEFNQADLLLYFRNELRTIIQSESSNENKVLFDTPQRKLIMKRVYMSIDPYLKNLRDCKRLLNAYQIRYFVCSRFCDADDLLCIVLLEVFEPGAISYLINHYDEFYPSVFPEPNNVSAEDIENYRDGIKKEANCSEQALKVLASLFPSLAKKIDETSSAPLAGSRGVVENKISERENFLSYFILSPNENAVFSDVIKDLLLHWDEARITNALKQWVDKDKLQNAFSKICAYCDLQNQDVKLEQDRWKPILHGISSIQSIRPYSNQTCTWTNIPWAVVEKIMGWPIFDGGPERVNMDTAGWIVDIFRDEHVSLETLEVLMWHIGSGYAWALPESYSDSAPEVDENLFMSCKELFIRRLKGNLSKEGFFDSVMIDLFLAHLMKEDVAYLNQYLASLSTIESIYPWLKVALEEEKNRNYYGFKRRAWHHKDDLLAITPTAYAALVDTELDKMPKDWLSDQKWTTLVLYDAYARQEPWAQTKGALIKEETLEEYGNKVYHERNKINQEE
jgi:hypothetical protein